MYKIIAFDMDGTLINSDVLIYKTWEELFLTFKNKDYVIDKKRTQSYSGPKLEDSIFDAFPEYDQKFMLEQYKERTKKYYKSDLSIFKNTKKVLTLLKNKGYQLAIVTSKNREMTEYSLKKCHIFNLFSFLVCSDDVTKTKPDPEGMYLLLNHFNVSNKDVLFIGDTEFDYLTSKYASIDCILMTMCERNFKSTIIPLNYAKDYNELYKEILFYEHK